MQPTPARVNKLLNPRASQLGAGRTLVQGPVWLASGEGGDWEGVSGLYWLSLLSCAHASFLDFSSAAYWVAPRKA